MLCIMIGVCEAHYPEEEDHEDKLALFTTKEKALDYVQKSELKSHNEICGRGQHRNQFRKTSLLRGYCYAKIELYEEENLPIDPVIEEKAK